MSRRKKKEGSWARSRAVVRGCVGMGKKKVKVQRRTIIDRHYWYRRPSDPARFQSAYDRSHLDVCAGCRECDKWARKTVHMIRFERW